MQDLEGTVRWWLAEAHVRQPSSAAAKVQCLEKPASARPKGSGDRDCLLEAWDASKPSTMLDGKQLCKPSSTSSRTEQWR